MAKGQWANSMYGGPNRAARLFRNPQKEKEVAAAKAAQEKIDNPYGLTKKQKEAENALKYGEDRGQTLTGGTLQQAGEGRALVRSRLENVFQGNSAGANRLRESQNQDMKSMKAQQALQGGGSQMAAGQQQAAQREQSRDLANFVSDEKRQTISDLSKEYRGMGSDITNTSGQYAGIMMGAQPLAAPKQGGGGLISSIFGGLF